MANQETVLTGGRLVRVVTIQVQNPGGLTTSLRATAQIGEFIGSEDGVFEASVDTTMNADLSTSVEVVSEEISSAFPNPLDLLTRTRDPGLILLYPALAGLGSLMNICSAYVRQRLSIRLLHIC